MGERKGEREKKEGKNQERVRNGTRGMSGPRVASQPRPLCPDTAAIRGQQLGSGRQEKDKPVLELK